MFRGYKPVKARNTGKRHQPIVAQPSSIRRVQLPTRVRMMFNTFRANSCTENAFHDLLCVPLLLDYLGACQTSLAHRHIASTISLYSCNELVKSVGMIHWGIIEHIRSSNFRCLFYFTVSYDGFNWKYFYVSRIIRNYTISY